MSGGTPRPRANEREAAGRPPGGPPEGTESGEPLFTLAKTTNTTVEFTVC